MRFKSTDFVVLLAAASALTGVSLTASSPAVAQTQQPTMTSPMTTKVAKDTMQASRIMMPHSNYGKLKAELARSSDPVKNAILQAAVDRLQKSHPGGVANDSWSFSLSFSLSWGSAMQERGNQTIHD
jgi:hypothetical protein